MEQGKPIEYVRGFTEFLGCKIDLSKKPLIPRRETEFWVEKAIKKISHNLQSFGKCSIGVLDIFSGSGCIGIAILKNIKNSEVVFADKDKKCLEQIKINLRINIPSYKLHGREVCRTVQSDVFEGLTLQKLKHLGGQGFDYIFANPPYVAELMRHKVQKSVLDSEPKSALFGGKDGLFYIKKFLKGAGGHLNSGGRIFMEFSPEQKKEIKKFIEKYNYKTYEFHKDQYGRWRWVVIG